MKTILTAVAFSVAAAASASAADIPARMPVKAPAPVVAAAYNWSGFYTATGLGWGRWDIDGRYVAVPADRHHTRDDRGWLGSIVGVQQQWGQWVFGLEGSYNSPWDRDFAASRSVTADCLGGSALADRTCLSRIRNYWTFGGKAGFAVNNFMIYGTGGYANGKIQTRTLVTSTGVLTSTTDERHGGWYAGAGIDMYVTKFLWSDLIIGIEYQHVDLGRELHVDRLAGATGVNNRNMDATIDIVRARATFKYSLGSDAVVARY